MSFPRAFSGVIDRRRAMALAGAGALAALMPGRAFAQVSDGWRRVAEVMAVVGDADPIAQGIVLEMPLVSENGASVPLKVLVDRPMADDEYVAALHIFAPGNPFPEVASFHFTPRAGRPEVETRVRLNESQTVIAIAELSSGSVLVGERAVRVTTSGCLTNPETYDSENLFRTRLRVPERFAAGTPGEVLTIINHPMETGLRADVSGEIVPERIIDRFEALIDGEPVFAADLRRSVSANPYLRFFIAPERSGTLDLRWTEDTGESAEASADIQVG